MSTTTLSSVTRSPAGSDTATTPKIYNSSIHNGTQSPTRTDEYPQLNSGSLYLDCAGAAIPPKAIIESYTKEITSTLYGNPHSGNHSPSSSITTDRINHIRARILSAMNAPISSSLAKENRNDAYTVVFTSNATAAMKLVAECKNWELCDLWRLNDAHTSMIGMREYVHRDRNSDQSGSELDKESAVKVFTQDQIETILRDGMSECSHSDSDDRDIMFTYLAQSNFNGRRYPLRWIREFKELANRRYQNELCNKPMTRLASTHIQTRPPIHRVLVDASSYGFFDLSRYPADFVILSFYKLFGFPTGVAALVMTESAANSLSNKRYFGGGTIDAVDPYGDWKLLRRDSRARFEDGTVPFLEIIGVGCALDWMERRWIGGWKGLKRYGEGLGRAARRLMKELRHGQSGRRVCILYDNIDGNGGGYDDNVYNDDDFGPVIAFNLLRADGTVVRPSTVARMASLHDIHLRIGCFCNAGACANALGISSDGIRKNALVHKHVCGDDVDFIEGRVVAAVRISFGHVNCEKDVERWISFLRANFVEQDDPVSENIQTKMNKIPDSVVTDMELLATVPPLVVKSIHLFPIKSCGGIMVDNWPIGSQGLLFDRHLVVVDSKTGVVLSQKRVGKLASISPVEINLAGGWVVFAAEGRNDTVKILLDQSVSDDGNRIQIPRTTVLNGTIDLMVCGRREAGSGYNEREVSKWFSDVLGIDCHLVSQSNQENLKPGNEPAIAFQNDSQFLLISEQSFKSLDKELRKASGGNAPNDIILRFRANIVVGFPGGHDDNGSSSFAPFEEELWVGKIVSIGGQKFEIQDRCKRCGVIGKELFSALCKHRKNQGSVYFGLHMRHDAGSSSLPYRLSSGMTVTASFIGAVPDETCDK
ncbi:hypothetical protein HDU76_013445 [Blyttiomyces sp. JEL0837]|nr:hypothetical protein HDU76_013445 [Blyttiomyces sp. JEL0837]